MQVIGLVLLTTNKTTDIKDTMGLVDSHVSERVKMAPAVTTAISRTGLTSFRTAVVHIIFTTSNTGADVSCDQWHTQEFFLGGGPSQGFWRQL